VIPHELEALVDLDGWLHRLPHRRACGVAESLGAWTNPRGVERRAPSREQYPDVREVSVMDEASTALESLEQFVGDWEMEVTFPGASPVGGAQTSFEWMPGELLLLQRWEVPIPEAPDGLAVYGWDELRGTLLQHYFDTRGVVRVYEMSLEGRSWTLERTEADFSPLNFSQRFSATFSEDGKTIEGRWEIAHDHHSTYKKDFDIVYRKVG
jgi:hypothetical protein